ncbi:response regulator transcription factor [Williamsia sp. CHRR-6]|uniref:response regulator transcription factor n=1 Tax=Williamsia sp. CHRR-6 TaxID=2835871 RepID=UPI001BDB0A29|nr:response regulator transcription factor [Williamsia sp. CHRR-6]MBT0566365.1 response regulator transcription factor [Williamsia sp. CHRR-6]
MTAVDGAPPTPATPATSTVLVVDDDDTVREVVRRYLTRAGHSVVEAVDGPGAVAAMHRHGPDAVVLDVMLPGIDGLDVCRHIRRTSAVPIIMLTALGEESDRVSGLEFGADDYVVKPFSPRELALRVGKILARSQPQATLAHAVVDGDLRLDLDARTVTRAGHDISLTSREFDLLAFFVTHPGAVFSRTTLMERVWDWSFGDQSTVTVHVRRLRAKIETDPATPTRIVTVWGVGYRFDPTA